MQSVLKVSHSANYFYIAELHFDNSLNSTVKNDTSPAGKMTMGVINHVAQFERDLLIERTQSGLDRAKANGKILGRPNVLSDAQKIQAIQNLQAGKAVAAIARDLNVSRQTIMRVRDDRALSD